MQFSESWLRSFIDPPMSTAELAQALTMAGLEVEDTRPIAPPFSGVVIGQVKTVAAHPNADKLRVCTVDVGADQLLTIVCGAPNVAVDMKVPCACVGAQLPPASTSAEPLQIKLSSLRGVESQGMLCAARELGLADEQTGLLVLPADAPIGTDFRIYADLDDTIFIIKLTPDKGHALSVLGIAREVAAITGAPLKHLASVTVPVTINDRLPVRIDATDLCGRFAGRVIRDVNANAATPDWIKQRLARAGQRNISVLVDLSNYLMLELGQPSHVFDLDAIHGDLQVRWASDGESIELLNEQTVLLDQRVGVVADAQAALSIAGIMGGQSTAVSLDTKNVYVEAAFWWPQAIRGRARRYQLTTDAGHRFERGVDYAQTVAVLERLTALIVECCGGKVGPVDDQSPHLPTRRPVNLRISRVAKVLGMALSAQQCADIFSRLAIPHQVNGDVIEAMPPSYRFDLEIEEDLIEEVVRIHGFDRIPVRPVRAAQTLKADREASRSKHAIRRLLADRGYQETINYSFIDRSVEADFGSNGAPIALLNPIASQLAVMRSNLLGSLMQVLQYNLNRRADRVRLFEISRVFQRDASVTDDFSNVAGIAQPLHVALLAYGPAMPPQWGAEKRAIDFFDVKADIEALCAGCGTVRFDPVQDIQHLHPGRAAQVVLNDQVIGLIGELHPRLQQRYELPQAPVITELVAAALQKLAFPDYREPSRFPPVRRDLAVIVDQSVSAQQVHDCILAGLRIEAPKSLQNELVLFDQYRGKGLLNNDKSLAFRISIQDTETTLQDEFVDALMQKIVARLLHELNARLRV